MTKAIRGIRRGDRRAVSSVLAMMFIVLFGSLAAVMGIVAQSNLRTAATGLQMSRAMSAAETGLVFAENRLRSQTARFIVTKGVVDTDYAEALWLGTYDESADGAVDVLPAVGFVEGGLPAGIVHAIRNAHLADSHSFVAIASDNALPDINTSTGTLRVRPIRLTNAADTSYYRLKYELVDGQPLVRVTSQGVDGDITRTLQLDFRLNKRIEFAVLSPNRIMIGKNVRIEGPLGTRFGLEAGEFSGSNSHPLLMRSDFAFLDAALDAKLNTFFGQLEQFDVDGDGRLRPDHPVEGLGVDGYGELVDADGDEYISDYDLFLDHFDTNADGRVCYDVALASAAGMTGMNMEFDVDLQLARLIDLFNPDRDDDGIPNTANDIALGYNDGVIDARDMYAKVHGRLMFGVARSNWETQLSIPTYQRVVVGPVRSGMYIAPVAFEVDEDEMRSVETSMLIESQTWFDTAANGAAFSTQASSGGTFTPASAATWEGVPFGSVGAYDHYMRPIYDGYTFHNVRIPRGTNALFRNCTFVGVTYIQTEGDCGHENWNYAGAFAAVTDPSGTVTYVLKYPGLAAELDDGTSVSDTRTQSNNLRFHSCTFLGSITGDRPEEYTHWRNKIQFTGDTRFYIDPADADLLDQPDAATLAGHLNGISALDRQEMAKSSIFLPGWSIDAGSFTNEAPLIKLKGTIIAGILDIRGNADVHGTLLMTFRPVLGAGPLFYGGLPDAFNTTIGYFGPADGDGEGVDPNDAAFVGFGQITLRYDPNALLPDGIPWPCSVEPQPLTYMEGGSL